MIRRRKVVVGLSLVAALVGHSGTCAIAAEPKWESLIPAIDPTKQAVAGEWAKTATELTVRAAQGRGWRWGPHRRVNMTCGPASLAKRGSIPSVWSWSTAGTLARLSA